MSFVVETIIPNPRLRRADCVRRATLRQWQLPCYAICGSGVALFSAERLLPRATAPNPGCDSRAANRARRSLMAAGRSCSTGKDLSKASLITAIEEDERRRQRI